MLKKEDKKDGIGPYIPPQCKIPFVFSLALTKAFSRKDTFILDPSLDHKLWKLMKDDIRMSVRENNPNRV